MSNGWWMVLGAFVAAPLWFVAALLVYRRIWRSARKLSARTKGHDQLVELGHLAGGLAHEIKNPLSTVNMNLKLLAEDIARQDDPESQRSLRRLANVQTETARLKDILDDFLRYAGRMELTPEVIDLRRIVGELTDFFAPQADASRVVLRTSLPEQAVRVCVDVNLLKQALLNLMINALQAMPGGGELLIKLSSQRRSAVVEVIDTGGGIAPDELPRIFQVYYSTKSHGMGLGLPTTRRIIREHGGTIQVDSQPGKGTRFLITLSLAPEK
jgi:signal transduction histidine kinase